MITADSFFEHSMTINESIQKWLKELSRINNEISCCKKEFQPVYDEIITTYTDALNKAEEMGDKLRAEECRKKIASYGTFEDYVSDRVPPYLVTMRQAYSELINRAMFLKQTAVQFTDDYAYLSLAVSFPKGNVFANPFEVQDIISQMKNCFEHSFSTYLEPKSYQSAEIMKLASEKIVRKYSMGDDAVDKDTLFNLTPVTDTAETGIDNFFVKTAFADKCKTLEFFLDEEDNISDDDTVSRELRENAVRTVCSDDEVKVYIRHLKNNDYDKTDLLDSNFYIIRNALMEYGICKELTDIADRMLKNPVFADNKSALGKLRIRAEKKCTELKPAILLPKYLQCKENISVAEQALGRDDLDDAGKKFFLDLKTNSVNEKSGLNMQDYRRFYEKYAKSMEKRHGKSLKKQLERE